MNFIKGSVFTITDLKEDNKMESFISSYEHRHFSIEPRGSHPDKLACKLLEQFQWRNNICISAPDPQGNICTGECLECSTSNLGRSIKSLINNSNQSSMLFHAQGVGSMMYVQN